MNEGDIIKTFSNWKDLMKYLDKQVEINLEKIGQEIAGVLKRYVQTNWYDARDEGYYQRTMDVLNSITVEKAKPIKNGYEVRIFFDESKIRMIEYDEFFNAHMSVDGSGMYGGWSIPKWVVYWMNYGQNSPLYSYEGVHFLEDTIEWTKDDNYHINRMKELLEAKGFKCI